MRRIIDSAIFGAVALALAACGFHPLYGQMGGSHGASGIFNSVYVQPIDLEYVGYELRNDLVDDFQGSDMPDKAAYELKVSLHERNEPIAIQNQTVGTLQEVELTRYNYTLTATYQLIDRKTEKVITKGTESSLSAYDVVQSPYSTLVAKQQAQSRTAADISQQLRLRLAVYLAQHAGQAQ